MLHSDNRHRGFLSNDIVVSPTMNPIARQIERRKARRRMSSFYSRYIGMGDLVFDVGANHGNRTEVFLSLGAKVVAFEPQPACARDLAKRFSGDPNFFLVQKGLGERAGEGTMYLCRADTISSMSQEWMASVRGSGRFGDLDWDGSLAIEVSTLHDEMARFGTPSFIKIDVEGYEGKVLAGLDHRVRALSFEFTPESFASTRDCMDRLRQLGDYEFNYSIGETMSMVLPSPVCSNDMLGIMKRLSDGHSRDFGDIYAFLKGD